MPTRERTPYPTFYDPDQFYTAEEMTTFQRHADERGTTGTEWVTTIPRTTTGKDEVAARDWRRRTGTKERRA